jgi:hypothetical protein
MCKIFYLLGEVRNFPGSVWITRHSYDAFPGASAGDRYCANSLRVADDSPGDAGGATQMPISGTHAGSQANPADVSQG